MVRKVLIKGGMIVNKKSKKKEFALSNIINSFIDNNLKNTGKTHEHVKEQLDDACANINKMLDIIKNDVNLLIHHKKRGGVLRGNIPSRRDTCEKSDRLICSKKYIVSHKNQIDKAEKHEKAFAGSEVLFERAIFNQKARDIKITNHDKEKNIKLIAWEAPLLRNDQDLSKKNSRPSKVSSRAIRCDLVGINTHKKTLYCIELKTRPDQESTRPAYGLIEAFAYGSFLLSHIQDKSKLQEITDEINLCISDYCKHPEKLKLGNIKNYKVEYIVAAPKSYFEYIIKKSRTVTRRSRIKEGVKEVKMIEKLLTKSKHLAFAGYLILNKNPKDVKFRISKDNKQTNNYYEPYFAEDVFLLAELKESFSAIEKMISD